jgi:hypothetical protein
MSNAVLWQHVVCILSAMLRAALHSVHTPQPETHAATLHYL